MNVIVNTTDDNKRTVEIYNKGLQKIVSQVYDASDNAQREAALNYAIELSEVLDCSVIFQERAGMDIITMQK